jgi:undecaprenyl-diphosphatase
MTILHAVLLGIVEGITEFLPISSTGHLMLTETLMRIPLTSSVESFNIAIQLGAILAVLVLYGKHLLKDKSLIILAIIGFIPTGFIGLFLHRIVKAYLLSNITVVGWSLLIGGIVLIAFEFFIKKTRHVDQNQAITINQSLAIGICQSFAMIPGVSRSAATIVGGMMLGISRPAIVEFSFILAIPTMIAATALDLRSSIGAFSSNDLLALSIGFVLSFVTAIVAIRWLLRFVTNHTFVPFGIYRIIVGGLILLFL